MPLFAKKVKIYEVKGKKAEWKSVRAALKEAGIAGVSTGIWQDEPPVGGCGAHLDGRDFGPNGRIDRDIYVIRVPEDAEMPFPGNFDGRKCICRQCSEI